MNAVVGVLAALQALRDGKPVLVLDDTDREDEGDVVLAAETLSATWMGWTIRHSSGYVCAPMPQEWADRLQLPLMVPDGQDPLRTAYGVTVDALTGVSTGISASDRTRTVRLLAEPGTVAADLRRPGHVVPLRARPGGVLERRGHTEAAVDLCRLAGLAPVAAIAELVDDDGEMLRGPAVQELGAATGLPVISVADLVVHVRNAGRVERVASTTVPTVHGRFTVHGYRDRRTGAEHLALCHPGEPRVDGEVPVPLVRLHSECLTGEALGSLRCDCGPQLEEALSRVATEGGVVVYLRGHEGRGVGLLDKLRAYAQQDTGADTVTAQQALGLPVDAREYAAGAAVLHDLQIPRVRLLSHNPEKSRALREAGIEVTEELSCATVAQPQAAAYLRTKVERLGHRPHRLPPTAT